MSSKPDELNRLHQLIQSLVNCHSPSGAELEMDNFLLQELEARRMVPVADDAGNLTVAVSGASNARRIVITAHKDELGMLVGKITEDGRIFPVRLNGAYPWVYGEGPVEILGDRTIVLGILSFGSRHVSEPSPTFALQNQRALLWRDTWIETKLDARELAKRGVRIGSRIVIARARKRVVSLPQNYIASYALDNRAAMAALLTLIPSIERARFDTWFSFTAKEELGAVGALYLFTQLRPTDVIALEICPTSDECEIDNPHIPYLIARDGHGIYDDGLTREIAERAQDFGIDLSSRVLSRFGSDASISMKFGHVPRAACLAIPTTNSHGFEIASLMAIRCVALVLNALIQAPPTSE